MRTVLPSHRLRALHAAVLASLALGAPIAIGTAHADAGLQPAPGNTLNPAPLHPSTAGRWMFEEGMGTRNPAARSPTGRLFEMPLDPGEEAEAEAKKDAWTTTGFVELGGMRTFGDDRSQGFLNYKDVKGGAYLNVFGLSAEKAGEARFFEAAGGGVGMHDQFYRFQVGRYNDWKVSAFYEGTPQTFTTSYRSLWNGVGGGSLGLYSLKPGGTASAAATQANIQAALAATDESQLDVIRKKAGVRIDKQLGESWKAYASFTNEKREGARPFGAVFGGGGGGGNFELPEPIDYQTHDLLAGVQFTGAASSFNLRASASFFRNDVDTLTFQNPLYISLNGSGGLTPATFTQGRLDLPPNNEHYNVKGEYAHALPDFHRGNFTATVALGTMRQNDDLLSPTEYPLTGGTVSAGGAPLAQVWNTPAALSQPSADARLDTRLADLGLALKPAAGLDVKGKLRYYETRNSSQYLSCNPLTGQWGRLLNEGSGLSLVTANTMARVNPTGTSANAYNAARCDLAAVQALGLVPASGSIPIASVPNDYRQINASLAADYRLGRASSVTAAIEREAYRRDFREREETWEDKVRLGYVDRGTIDGTMRLSYEHARRGGSAYDQDAYVPFLSASFGPTPATGTPNVSSWFHGIDQFRSFDLADRRQDVVNGRVDYAFHPNVDGAMTLQAKDARFPAAYGRTGHQKSSSASLDLNWLAGPGAVLYGFYSFQSGSMEQKGIQAFSCILGYTYYFYSDGRVATTTTGAAPPATPTGTTLVSTQNVVAGNWSDTCGTASAASPMLPESRGWTVSSRDRNHVIGFGLRYDLGKAKLDTNFTRALGRTRIGYAYNAAALGLTTAQVALAGDGLDDLAFAQNVLTASLTAPIGKDVSVRFLVRHESGRIRDWHYDGVAQNPMPTNNAVYLDGGPQDYRATLLGIFFQVRM